MGPATHIPFRFFCSFPCVVVAAAALLGVLAGALPPIGAADADLAAFFGAVEVESNGADNDEHNQNDNRIYHRLFAHRVALGTMQRVRLLDPVV